MKQVNIQPNVSDPEAKKTFKKFGETINDLIGKILLKDNTEEFTPDADYEPATKKYVDDKTWTNIQDADGDTLIETEESADSDEIQIKTANVECGRFHDDGIVDFPKQSACRLSTTTDATISDETDTKVELDTSDFDVQSEGDVSVNYRITVTEDGKYLVGGKLQMSTTVQYFVETKIFVNGVGHQPTGLDVGNGIWSTPNNVDLLDLDASDYVELYVYQNSDGNETLTQGALFLVKVA